MDRTSQDRPVQPLRSVRNEVQPKLRVSWLFRAGYVAKYPSETFETWDAVEYFRLHPKEEAVCATCPDVSCGCPTGIDIPQSLTSLHTEMIELRDRGLVAPAADAAPTVGRREFGARLVLRELPARLTAGERTLVRIGVENTGTRSWLAEKNRNRGRVLLSVTLGAAVPVTVPLRGDVHPGGRGHFILELTAPPVPGQFPLRLQLLGEHERFSPKSGPVLHDGAIEVVGDDSAAGRPEPTTGDGLPGLAVEWLEHNLPAEWPDDSPFHAYVRLANRGKQTWLASHSDGKHAELTVRFRLGRTHHIRLPRSVPPGEEITIGVPLMLAGRLGSSWTVRFGLIERTGGWLGSRRARPLARCACGSRHLRPVLTARAVALARRSNNWGYQPTEGVARGRDGRPYPLFLQEARGCRVRDLDGKEWIDFVMGWGCALLGYAHPEVQAAVAPHLQSGAVLSLPHALEMELTQALLARFPRSDAVLFGKNGSDVCTAAVRIARMHTGRRRVLFSGYHGWQDWYADAASPELAGPGCFADRVPLPVQRLRGLPKTDR